MILSASRRTDIPCYYSEWFINRIRAGYVLTRNPMNHAQISRIPLTPDIIDCIVFWTKDPLNIMPQLDELEALGYKYYFQFTLTPYDKTLEANLRPKHEIEDTFIELSNRIGKDHVVWRYDPIILNSMIDTSYHKEQFMRMCSKLSPYTDTVTISFVDMYSKLKTKLIRPVKENEIAELSAFIGKIANDYGIRAVACCEKEDLTKHGIEQSSCIDRRRIEKIIGCSLNIKPDRNQRTGCGCFESIDIGMYNTCLNGCVYCYANDSFSTTLRRNESHNPANELLIGSITDGEKIIDKKVKSDKQAQMGLF